MTSFNLPTSSSLNGLVLTGGQSSRMGTAKEAIQWHGKEQQYAMADLLDSFCDEVFISCRPDQKEDIDTAYRALTDIFSDMGPLGGILSAFQFQRDSAWLVVACDMPLLDKASIGFLIRSRDPARIATTYESPADGFPEPLVTIWEPESYPLLTDFVHSGNKSPRRFLMQNDVLILKPEYPNALINTNTPKEADQVREMLKRGNMDEI